MILLCSHNQGLDGSCVKQHTRRRRRPAGPNPPRRSAGPTHRSDVQWHTSPRPGRAGQTLHIASRSRMGLDLLNRR